MTKIIGLTGGIGSGKTTVAQEFLKYGVPIYISDLHAKEIMNQKETIELIRKIFGNAVFTNRRLDKALLSKVVFNNTEKLAALNNIIHPLVKIDFDSWLAQNQHHKFVIKETALLFETGNNRYCDKVILVTAPLETRIARVMQRDNISEELVLKKISSQLSDDIKIQKSDFIISNINLESTIKQVKEIYNFLSI